MIFAARSDLLAVTHLTWTVGAVLLNGERQRLFVRMRLKVDGLGTRWWVVPTVTTTTIMVAGIVSLWQPTLGLILAASVFLIGVLVLVASSLIARIDAFDPLFTGTLTFAVLFGVRPLLMIWGGEESYYGVDISESLTTATLLGLMGFSAFVVGYVCVSRSKIVSAEAAPTKDVPAPLARAALVGLTILGAAIYAAFLAWRFGSVGRGFEMVRAGRSLELASGFGGASEYLTAAPILATVGAAALVITQRGRLSLVDRVLLLAATCVPLLIFGFLGNRRFVIPAVLIPLVAWYLVTAVRPKWKTVIIGGAVAFLVLAAVPYARAAGARDQAGGFVPAMQALLKSPVELIVDRFLGSHDTEMVAALAVQTEIVRQPYWGRASVGDLLIAPIPSALFPKPVTARNEVLIEIYGAPCQAVGGRCPDFSVVGTFHQDLPYGGVVVGCLMLGAFSAWVWKKGTQPFASCSSVAVAACWAVMLPVLVRAGFMPAFAWFLYFALPLLGLLFLLPRVSRESRVRFRTDRSRV